MIDAVIFGFGCLVTLMCAAAIASLMRAAYLDGRYQKEQERKCELKLIKGHKNRREEFDSVTDDAQMVA